VKRIQLQLKGLEGEEEEKLAKNINTLIEELSALNDSAAQEQEWGGV